MMYIPQTQEKNTEQLSSTKDNEDVYVLYQYFKSDLPKMFRQLNTINNLPKDCVKKFQVNCTLLFKEHIRQYLF